MFKLFKVERWIEDYPGKFDIDIYLVSAQTASEATEVVNSKTHNNFKFVTTEMRDFTDGQAGEQIEVNRPFSCYIGDRVYDENPVDDNN